MKQPILLLALILSLLFVTSCTPKTVAPPPTEPPEISETPPPATTEPPNDNPYPINAESDYFRWAGTLSEHMRGAECWSSEKLHFMDCLELTLTDDSIGHFQRSMTFPIIDQPWAEELNQYYRDIFMEQREAWWVLFNEFLDSYGSDTKSWFPNQYSIAANDIYEWDHFFVVALSCSSFNGRGASWSQVDAFDTITGARLTVDNVFADEDWEELVRPALVATYEAYCREQNMEYSDHRSFPEDNALFVTPSGIGFQYRYGELHSMAGGAECLVIPYELLDGLLNPEIFG